MPRPVYNVLFLCTGNSARSILAEAILNREGQGRFAAYSAGSMPMGAVHPMALRFLKNGGYDTGFARSKSWEEFAKPGAPTMDFVFTVCDNAAAETCPIWPGQPVTAHWGIPDPAAVDGNESQRYLAFSDAYRRLHHRISLFLSLPLERLETMNLKNKLAMIGGAADPDSDPKKASAFRTPGTSVE